MKILFQNRDENAWIGGDMVQLRKTMSTLKKIGIDSDFSSELQPDLSGYDMVHLFHLSMAWTKYQCLNAWKQKKPIIISTIYHETDALVPYHHQQAVADTANAIICLHEGEKERIQRHLSVKDEKIHLIGNGIEEEFFAPFQKGNYALTVGRLDGTKGQLETAKACEKLGMEYLCIGERANEHYAKECELHGAKILPPMKREALIPYYRDCSVYVLASKAELMPLTVMEAGAQAKPIVLTEKCEWKIPDTVYVAPGDVADILNAIFYQAGKQAKKLQKNLKQMTWENVAKQLKQLYATAN